MHERTANRWFGVAEARRMIPFLLETFERVRKLLEEGRENTRSLEAGQFPRDEAIRRRGEVDRLARLIRTELVKVEEAGIVVKDVDGLVDFPAILGERHVYLCWKYPEKTVDHWHELDAGFAGRQPIKDESEFGPSYLS